LAVKGPRGIVPAPDPFRAGIVAMTLVALRRHLFRLPPVLAASVVLAGAGVPAFAQGSSSPADASPVVPGTDLGFRFHGYVRAGFGVNGEGKGQEPFAAPLAGAKYRLGNEAETYLETTFAYGVRTEDPEPAYFDTRITLAYITPTSQSNDFATTVSLREAYAVAKGVWTSRPDATFWAGARFYNRQDVHINDFYYRDPSGFGGGIEDVRVGSRARLSFAWIGGSTDELDPNGTVPRDELYRFNKNSLDVRVSQVPIGKFHLLVGGDLSHFSGDTVMVSGGPFVIEDNLGGSVTTILERPFERGRNRTAVQYGVGSAFNFRTLIAPPPGRTFEPGELVDLSELWQFRIVEDYMVERGEHWTLQATAVYQELDNGADALNRQRWVSIGARPVYKLGAHASLAAEAGWDYTRASGAPGGSLFKLTVAPQITPNLGFLSRPSLRAFATYAAWTDSFVGEVSPLTYGNGRHGVAFGVQFESWW
jgi:maltoporin